MNTIICLHLYMLLGLPVSCLMLKACNYDASNVYFAILGFSLCIAGKKNNSLTLSYLGTVAAVFGCLDKWSSLLYWCACVMLFVYAGMQRHEQWRIKIVYALKYTLLAVMSAFGISWLNMLYIRFLAGGELGAGINLGTVTFPFTYMLRILFTEDKTINLLDERAYCSNAVELLIVIGAIITLCAMLLAAFDEINRKVKIAEILVIVNAVLLGIGIVLGIWGAYFVPEYLAPFKEIESGYYLSKDTFNNVIYHFGALNGAEHFLRKTAYACEMLLFVPNIKIFSPLWVIRSEEYNSSVRKGEWYAGEAMTWGENMAIAGHKIRKMADKTGIEDYSRITIYGDYGAVWLANPGFKIASIGKGIDLNSLKWDNTEYIVLNKFKLYRYDVPEFINTVKPVDTISYKGEISSWIYRGDQLEEYKMYFQ